MELMISDEMVKSGRSNFIFTSGGRGAFFFSSALVVF